MFIVSSRVGWVIIGGPRSEKMVVGMNTFSTGSGQAVCQQWRGIRTEDWISMVFEFGGLQRGKARRATNQAGWGLHMPSYKVKRPEK